MVLGVAAALAAGLLLPPESARAGAQAHVSAAAWAAGPVPARAFAHPAPAAVVQETSATSARAGVRTTVLTLAVRGCEGCSITPVDAGPAGSVWTGRTKEVRAGSVHWRVALRHTTGMSFNIVDPGAVALDFMTNIVIAYRGLQVGERVEHRVAAHKRRANGCWAGTRKPAVKLRVRVEQFPSLSDLPPVVMGYAIRPYLRRTARHVPLAGGAAFSAADHGVIGNQDAYFCSK
jgi:hypothetical protein